ncbi:unnamed protein product [Cladocopium goreaui]|uniref:Uncharacterized protein n=1 Tax=Cladocopium goreaui TaxID=2562237 RepID=A0A9P1FQK4_9DINO|nr:unnamed protein product [Cladocopium goreaui]
MVVFDALKWRAPPAMILFILLVQWNMQIPHRQDRQFVEIFSGRGEVSRALRDAGFRGTSFDWELDKRAFDLTGNAAFASFV